MIRAKKVIAMTFAVAALILVATTIVSAVDGPAVMVTRYTVEPEALMPGDTGTITLTIKNPSMTAKSSETAMTYGQAGSPEQSTTTESTRDNSAEIKTIRLSSRGSGIEWSSEGFQRT